MHSSPYAMVSFCAALAAIAGLLTPAMTRAQTFLPDWVQLSPATSPGVRYSAEMAYDSVHGQVVLFGGVNSSSDVFQDTWLWNGTTSTPANPATNPPAPIGRHGV